MTNTKMYPEKDVTERPVTSTQPLSEPIPGFVDYSSEEQYAFTKWKRLIEDVFATNGFSYIHLRPFERKAALLGPGETQKQVFGVSRLNAEVADTELAIPYDRTVPFALWVVQHGNEISFPFKRQDVSLSYRGEAPRPGRFRAFIQADIDLVGRNLGLDADVECLATLLRAVATLDLGTPFYVYLNHISIVKAMMRAFGVPQGLHRDVFRLIDKLDKLSQQQVIDEIAKLPDIDVDRSGLETMVKKFAQRSSPEAFIFDQNYGPEAESGLQDILNMVKFLQAAGIDTSCIQLAPGMVRGLDYYTGIVFETFLQGKESYGSIASGGRYSNLVGDFDPKYADIEGVGGSIGLTRLFDIMMRENMPLPGRSTIADVLVGYRTEEQRRLGYQIAASLREKGVPTDFYCGKQGIKNMLNHANKIGVPITVCAMDSNSFVVKEMNRTNVAREYKGMDFPSPREAIEAVLLLLGG